MLEMICLNRSGKEDVATILGDVLAIRVLIENAAKDANEATRTSMRHMVEEFRKYIKEDVFGKRSYGEEEIICDPNVLAYVTAESPPKKRRKSNSMSEEDAVAGQGWKSQQQKEQAPDALAEDGSGKPGEPPVEAAAGSSSKGPDPVVVEKATKAEVDPRAVQLKEIDRNFERILASISVVGMKSENVIEEAPGTAAGAADETDESVGVAMEENEIAAEKPLGDGGDREAGSGEPDVQPPPPPSTSA